MKGRYDALIESIQITVYRPRPTIRECRTCHRIIRQSNVPRTVRTWLRISSNSPTRMTSRFRRLRRLRSAAVGRRKTNRTVMAATIALVSRIKNGMGGSQTSATRTKARALRSSTTAASVRTPDSARQVVLPCGGRTQNRGWMQILAANSIQHGQQAQPTLEFSG